MTPKRWARHGIDLAAATMGGLAWLRRRAMADRTVLTYHRILPDEECARYPLDSLVTARSHFERQVQWLARETSVVTSREMLDRCGDSSGARPIVSLTFDDGYADNAEIAAPILEANGVRGTFFVTTGFVESGGMLWVDAAALSWGRSADTCRRVAGGDRTNGVEPDAIRSLGEWMAFLKRLPTVRRARVLEDVGRSLDVSDAAPAFRAMSVQQVRDLHARGHEIGSHTVTHPILPNCTDSELEQEVVNARATLAKWIDADVPGFCYPNGDHAERIVRCVRAAGHTYAFTTGRGTVPSDPQDPFRLPRRMISSSSSVGPTGRVSAAAFWSEVWGLHDWLRPARAQRPGVMGGPAGPGEAHA